MYAQKVRSDIDIVFQGVIQSIKCKRKRAIFSKLSHSTLLLNTSIKIIKNVKNIENHESKYCSVIGF